MKIIGLLVFLAALIVGSAAAAFMAFGRADFRLVKFSFNNNVQGSGNVIKENRDIGEFDAINVSGVFEVEFTAQKEYSVEVEADDNLMPIVRTEVKGGVLRISNRDGISKYTRLLVRVSAPDLKSVKTSGAAKITVTDIKNSEFSVKSTGASNVSVAGNTGELDVDASGAASINAAGLEAATADIDASGVAKIEVSAAQKLKVDASGGSRIIYNGNPSDIQKRTSGAASVSQK